jgi:5-methylcytosine-specific restriction endonuclease McrA
MKRAFVNELRELAGRRCDYCRMPERFDPLAFQVDHIIAEQHGGATLLNNLAWSCLHCNVHS